jgi:pimeloyl-ACP methyl ester carboxylesterase
MTTIEETRTIAEVSPRTVSTSDGRRIAVWRTGPDVPVSPGRVALVAPGFARRMRHMAHAARYLAENGFVVYRCDYVDHVGLSEGEIGHCSIGDMYDTLVAVHGYILDAEQVDSAVIIAASLGARPSFRLAATVGRVSGIVGIVGVVNARYTLNEAFGVDYGGRGPDDWGDDDSVEFESKLIHGRQFVENLRADDWLDAASTMRDLAGVGCPIANFCGSADGWVNVAEVQEVFAAAQGHARVVELPFAEHDVSRNAVAVQTMLREITRCAIEFVTGDDPAAIQVAEPSFTDLVSQIPYERSLESAASRT